MYGLLECISVFDLVVYFPVLFVAFIIFRISLMYEITAYGFQAAFLSIFAVLRVTQDCIPAFMLMADVSFYLSLACSIFAILFDEKRELWLNSQLRQMHSNIKIRPMPRGYRPRITKKEYYLTPGITMTLALICLSLNFSQYKDSKLIIISVLLSLYSLIRMWKTLIYVK